MMQSSRRIDRAEAGASAATFFIKKQFLYSKIYFVRIINELNLYIENDTFSHEIVLVKNVLKFFS